MREEHIIEAAFIDKLQNDLKYTYRDDIRDKESLELNFRKKFEELNRVNLTDAEFSRLKDEIISDDVFKASKTLRSQNTFIREDNTPLQYTLVNIKDWCKNEYEVINQLRVNTDNSHHRYDVIILINGIPVVQVELKSTKVNTRKAMEQIVEYKNDKGNGYLNSLMCFMQLFIVSNENDTYYFSNNNNQHFNFNADEQFLPIYQMATEEKNTPIRNLFAFSSAFLPKCTLGEMISRYMVLVATEQKILVMRPYQVYAVKNIIKCIEENRGNGYIWHTTGSGKTLTSFKASTLLKDNLNIDKCLFVVDRKDLDRQTRDEFNKFQENCVEENTNTDRLVKKMLSEDKNDKIIVTTIQKLGIALDPKQKKDYKSRLLPLQDKRIIFIFDECHRSQFGENHEAIKEFFKNHQLFGFTGTPIFEENAVQVSRTGNKAHYKITEDVFPSILHSYTITNAIEDKNVLRFHVDYFKGKGEKVASKNITLPKDKIVDNIIEKHNGATNGRKFNALFATSSINDAIRYHQIFKEKQGELLASVDGYEPLNIACVFSPPAGLSADAKQMQEDLENEREDYKQNPEEKKNALIAIINDYNKQYDTNHSINDFDAYYQDVQQRIKDQKYSNGDYAHCNKVDIVIVVDMLLTGFDSKYLNTLYVDKPLKHHGLIQAFSRTNRVLNDSKPAGNILDYRGQQDSVDDAIKLFSQKNEDPNKVREIWLVDPAPAVIEKFEKAVAKLQQFMSNQGVECTAEAAQNLKGTNARIEFVTCYKEVQRHRTQLEQYTDLSEEQKGVIEELMPEKDSRAFKGAYNETVRQLKVEQGKKGKDRDKDLDNLDFELVLFASATIDYDYIMQLIAKYQNSDPQTTRWEATRDELVSLIASSANMMDEKDDIIEYLDTLGEIKGLSEKELKDGYKRFVMGKNQKVIRGIAEDHNIDYDSLQSFVDNIITLMRFDDSNLSDLLAPLELGWKARTQKKLELMSDLMPELEKMAKGNEISGLSVYEK